jgi:hypothetical protein
MLTVDTFNPRVRSGELAKLFVGFAGWFAVYEDVWVTRVTHSVNSRSVGWTTLADVIRANGAVERDVPGHKLNCEWRR